MRACILPLGLVLVASAIPWTPASAQQKTLHRETDSVVLAGTELPAALGRPIEALRLAAFRDGRLAPVPFQFDERDPGGDYVFRSSDPLATDADTGRLDDNDELAFMARDAGDRLPEGSALGSRVLAELELADPVNGGTGWCYLTTRETVPNLSPVDYVRYDPANDRILARNYHHGISEAAPIAYGDTTVTPAGGGNNARINERVLTRLSARLLKIFRIQRSEEDFRSDRKGYIDGNVRIIKRVGNSMRQVFGKYGPEVVVDYTFYFSHWIMPSIIDLPVDVGAFVSSLSLRGGTHWTPASEGMLFYTRYIPPGTAIIDGHMSEAERNMDLTLDTDNVWHLYTGAMNDPGQGSILFRILMDDKLRETLQVRTHYDDTFYEADHEDDPVTEDEYTSFFEGSYNWTGMEKLPKGKYRITSWASVMPTYRKPGDEKKYLDVLDRPVTVGIHTPGSPPAEGDAVP